MWVRVAACYCRAHMAPDARTADSDDVGDRLVGRTVANYRVLGRIGRGGMGAVYLAEHAMLQRYAAIKVLLREFSDNAELVARFMNEARATAQLRHGGFVQIFDSGKLPDGNAYLVMEYLRGVNLGAAIEWRHALTVDETLAVLHDVAKSLSYAHKHGIVHRDLKPDNVFLAVGSDELSGGGERVTVKVLDFGIAKLNGTSGGWMVSAHTRTGSLLGTPLYMSPEQCRGAGHVDHRTDIYSLGCLAYHAVTGQRPFPLEGFGEIIAAHLHEQPIPPRAIVPSLSEQVERLVLWLLEKDPGARPQTMDEVVAALDHLRRTQSGAPPELMALIPPAAMAPPASLFAVATGPRVATTPFDGERGLAPTPLPTAKSGDTRLLPSRTNLARRVSISTLSGSAAEMGAHWDVRAPRPRVGRRVAIAAAVVGGLAACVGLVVVLSGLGTHPGVRPPRRTDTTPPSPAMAPTPAAEIVTRVDPPAPAPPVHRPVLSAEPPVRAMVTVRIASIPPGASVLDAKTTHVIGETPFGTEVPRSDTERAFIVRKRGYRPKRLTIDASRNSEVTVTLDKRATGATTTGTPDRIDEDDKRKL
jgi:serine/threonine protein kinase